MTDGTEKLCLVLYGRKPESSDYLGGSDAKMLHDAVSRIHKLQKRAIQVAMAFRCDAYPLMHSEQKALLAGKKVSWRDCWLADIFARAFSELTIHPQFYDELRAEIFENESLKPK